jgi:predicted MPP superfamily phosphohydrolase
MKKIKLYIILAAAAILSVSCSYEKKTLKDTDVRDDFFIIWSLSDIQPRYFSDREGFDLAVSDVKHNLLKPEMAIVAGDIIHSRENAIVDYQWYVKTKELAGIDYWFEITGNHDMKDYESYKKYVSKPLHYSVTAGNMLMLFMSDEDRHPPQYISDDTFNWWKKQVIENQDKIIVTITHAYPKHSGLFMAEHIESRTILNSERFEEVLKKYRVDLWLAAHTHIPSFFGQNENRVEEFKNTTFINISRIRRDFNFNPESRVIILKNNSPVMTIKTRDHDDEKYIKRREIVINLPINFVFKSRKPKF